jgi:hypothetical protein
MAVKHLMDPGPRIPWPEERTEQIYTLLPYTPLMKPGLYLLLSVFLFLSIIFTACVEPDDNWKTLTPAVTPVPTGTSEDEWATLSPVTLLAIEESREALNEAADTVEQGDTGWLVAALPLELQEQTGEQPAISEADAAEIAQALRDAKEVEMHENIIFYETTYRGKPHSFYTIREWMIWKIVGF